MPNKFDFGSMVFNEAVMRERLAEDVYAALKETIKCGAPLARHIATPIAAAMKDWAIEKGATHFTHWFQPLTGITAEKHEAFISPGSNGGAILDFSGKELVVGESDASSFPSGGLRATFEARGYTAWDPTAYAFIKEDTLCIPTVFLSYDGDALDKKTPLLRSAQLINKEALRLVRAMGRTDIERITPSVGAEQEYFLVDKALWAKRRDLVLCGRTLFGAKPAKSQELDDHYYGTLDTRVKAFMADLDRELWKLGVFAKTEHKEVAPGQHELAPVFSGANSATDHNQLIMELMKRIAPKHGMVCLLHEKPFDGMNGSGKHNNWSLSTDSGENLFNPGKEPSENTLFLLLLTAVIAAVDDHQDLIRFSACSYSNDLRLGQTEAPPAVISVFLGDELNEILDTLSEGSDYSHTEQQFISMGVDAMPRVKADNTDRNRTSPFAFTGNKFEFRMPGSAQSIADANIVLNTVVAEAVARFADTLEKADDKEAAAREIIRSEYKKHKRIIYSGNCYSADWEKEAESRGLYNLKTTVEAQERSIAEENVALFSKYGIFSRREMLSRYEVSLETYAKLAEIEGRTMAEMTAQDIIPAVSRAQGELAETIYRKQQIGVRSESEVRTLKEGMDLLEQLNSAKSTLDEALKHAGEADCAHERACRCRDEVIPAMAAVRLAADSLESITPHEAWPFPNYEQLLLNAE